MKAKKVETFNFDKFIKTYDSLKKKSKYYANKTENPEEFFDGYFQAMTDMRNLIIDCSQ